MPVSPRDLSKVLAIIADEEEMKATVHGSLYGGVVTGTSATIGGLLLGPVGLAIGGTIGGLLGYASQQGKFKPVSEIINEMDTQRQRELYKALEDIIRNVDAQDFLSLLALVSGNPGALVRQQLLQGLKIFLENQMSLQVTE